jgi:hypothetical protein
MTTRNKQLKDRFLTHKGLFTLTIKGMDVWIHGNVVPYKNGNEAVENLYFFRSACGGYVVFDANDVCLVSRDDVISLRHPKDKATDTEQGDKP